MKNTPASSFIVKHKKIFVIIFLTLFTTAFIYLAATSASKRRPGVEITGSDTDIVHIKDGWWETRRLIYHGIPARCVLQLSPGADSNPDEVISAVWQEFDHIGAIFNPFDPNSEIFALNANPHTGLIKVSDDVYSVLSISKKLWMDTNGQFDPTMWQIKQLWQTAEKTQQIPSEKDIAAALRWTGFDQVRLNAKAQDLIEVESHPVKFDFGGIVKGYAVDRVRQILLNSNVTAGLVQLGGEIATFGDNDGKPWRVGIQHPKQMDRIWGVISSNNSLRVSTSGNYRQPIQINGKSFYHIFSPKTGRPVSEKILGVTTASFDGKTSNARLDGIATAITVIGTAKGLALAEKLHIDVLILYEKKDASIGEVMTPGLLNYYTPAEE